CAMPAEGYWGDYYEWGFDYW
nr:immunoglobulin heavy chain junction region [Macaca mulatta]MOY21589.1 immunoglobulin heavy chain junction region [Macaca mulatta]MOY21961.1 immunoglobulin heavy chain junction region [Macaca mulatta]MOY22047.1 immunoglobulin heavy chain junction region [Macaca mulatta]MOY22176.1 immunoglobulin heavy chain junction region [Macaca mulatta]